MRTVTVGDREAPLYSGDMQWDAAQSELLEAELADGLPVVVPTLARLTAMLGGTDPAVFHGPVPPLFGELTGEAVAYCCVLAGCLPREYPLVLEAAIATLAPEFNLLGIQTTTGTPTAAVLVHGPAVTALRMNAGTNCLGPGNRANACIGRALRLVLTNIGGARPMIGDMATMGQPAKYGMAFAEGAHSLTLPLHARRGMDKRESAVTVIGLSGTMEVLPEAGASTPEAVLRPVVAAMQGASRASFGGQPRQGGEQFLLLPPEMADILSRSQWTIGQAQEFLYRDASTDWPIARGPADIHVTIAGGAGVKMTTLVPWGGGSASVTRRLREF